MKTPILPWLLAVGLAAIGLPMHAAWAQSPPQAKAQTPAMALPEWDQLPQAQRDALVAPLRERWNRDPDGRARMLERATRWQAMTPDQRKRAHRGMQRWEHMDEAERRQMRALFERTRDMPPQQRRDTMALFHEMRGKTPEQRAQLRQQWLAMSPQQRAQWVRDHAPRRHGKPGRGERGMDDAHGPRPPAD